MTLTIIAAMSENGVIGRDGGLPWRLPADLKRFKARTSGHVVIMGRKTYESLAGPLPDRRMIVVTRDATYRAGDAIVVGSIDAAIDRGRDEAGPDGEVFILGGGEIYAQALPRVDRLDLTIIHAEVPGDVRFPPLDLGAWRLASDERHDADDRHAYPFSFRSYERANGKD